jgi:hypothetical protein
MKTAAIVLCAVCTLFSSLFGSIGDHAYSIVFVHIGGHLPDYLPIAVRQAHLFNPNSDLILVANQKAIQRAGKMLPSYLNLVTCESLPPTPLHTKFSEQSILDRQFRQGFWIHASERFFFLEECIEKFNLHHVFHLENDCMVYADFGKFLPILRSRYKGIVAPFEDDTYCVPCLVYFPDRKSIGHLTTYMAEFSTHPDRSMYEQTDMAALGSFRTVKGSKQLDSFPVVSKAYTTDFPLTCISKPEGERDPTIYFNQIEAFDSVFDGSGYGQYLGGIDPRNDVSTPGHVSPYDVVDRSKMSYIWEIDSQGRKVPYVIYKETKYRINNLHIHSKKLEQFYSGAS